MDKYTVRNHLLSDTFIMHTLVRTLSV